PSHVEGNVPNESWPSTGTVDGVTVGVAGTDGCAVFTGEGDPPLQAPTRAAAPTAASPQPTTLRPVTPRLDTLRPARTRGFPAPMEVLAFLPRRLPRTSAGGRTPT